jgi:hypothetical protein
VVVEVEVLAASELIDWAACCRGSTVQLALVDYVW